MLSSILSGAFCGMDSYLVRVEVDVAQGLPCMEMIGALSREAMEAKGRIRVALKNIGVKLPPSRITVNLSPADRHKSGTAFDLPAAVGLLASMGILDGKKLEGILFAGELGLSGEVRPIAGVLPIVRMAAERHIRCCIIPHGNGAEAAWADGITVYGAVHLKQIVKAFETSFGEAGLERIEQRADEAAVLEADAAEDSGEDFSDIIGQESAKRAAEIAAAGFHNLLLIGPPGSGKTMLASRIPTILPPLTRSEHLDILTIYSVAGKAFPGAFKGKRPFLAPHHTATACALTGGGRTPLPGAVSLAHRGVLFLDELPEFKRTVLDMLRQPLEEKRVSIARSYGTVIYPAEFMFVGAMNPCPCGYYPDEGRCTCSDAQVRQYLSHLSGPFLDRMDICAQMQKQKLEEIFGADTDAKTGFFAAAERESSREIRLRVCRARAMQKERFGEGGTERIRFNSEMGVQELEKFCHLDGECRKVLKSTAQVLDLSVRACHRIVRVARTIADLDGKTKIAACHVREALYYRTAAADYWGRGGER